LIRSGLVADVRHPSPIRGETAGALVEWSLEERHRFALFWKNPDIGGAVEEGQLASIGVPGGWNGGADWAQVAFENEILGLQQAFRFGTPVRELPRQTFARKKGRSSPIGAPDRKPSILGLQQSTGSTVEIENVDMGVNVEQRRPAGARKVQMGVVQALAGNRCRSAASIDPDQPSIRLNSLWDEEHGSVDGELRAMVDALENGNRISGDCEAMESWR
jgi:hypothetical protein